MSRRVPIDGVQMRLQREFRRLTIEQAAEHLGLETHVYAGLENGTRTLSKRQAIEVIRRLAEFRDDEDLAVAKRAAEARLGIPGASRPPMPEATP